MGPEFAVSRRTMLRGAALASTYIFTSTQFHAAPAGAVPSVAAASGSVEWQADAVYVTSVYYDAAWSQELTASFPVRLNIGDRTQPLKLAATWDSRLFTVHGPALTLVGESAAEEPFADSDEGNFAFEIPSDVEVVILQVQARNNYPLENLSDVTPTSLTLSDAQGNAVGVISPETVAAECAPWGVEVIVDWVSYDKDVVPAKLILKSTGPNAAPAGLQLIASYADVLAVPIITLVEDEDPPATVAEVSSGGLTELSITTSRELPPDTQVELLFSAEASDSVPPPFDGVVPVVRLVPPDVTVGMRKADKHESYPVTSSGSQLSTYLPAPSAD